MPAVFLLGQWMSAQDMPSCIANKKGANIAFKQRMILRDGRSVYAFAIKRPPRCIDCASGIMYLDSVCTTVASFTIGYAPGAFIHPGYAATDFPEASNPVFAKRLAAANPFPQRTGFIITHVADTLIAGAMEGDELDISTAEGLYHYKNGVLVNRYKIIPQKLDQPDRVVYYLEPAQRYFYIDMIKDTARLFISEKIIPVPGNTGTNKTLVWSETYQLKKK